MKAKDPWKALSDTVRRRPRPVEPAQEMRGGFDGRVLARLRDPRIRSAELWLRLAWRTVPVGAAVWLVCWLAVKSDVAPWPGADGAELTDLLITEVLPL
jgi:hypothetical protein